MGVHAQLTDMLDSLDPSGGPQQSSFPGLSFDAYDVLSSSDMDCEDEDLMAQSRAFRATLRSSRADSSHIPARSGIHDRSASNVRASTSPGKALRLSSISRTHGAGDGVDALGAEAVPRALGHGRGSKLVEVPQPSRSAFMAFRARAAASSHRAESAAADPLATEAGASASRAEAEGGALRCEANMTATALKTKADASALEEPEDPALVAAPSRQREQCQPQSEKAEPANSELSGGDSLDSLLGDLPPFPTDDPVSFWQSSGSSIWEEAHNLAAQTYEVDNHSDHLPAVGADDAAAGADVSAVVPSAAAVGADAGATAVAGARHCSDAAVATDALAYSNGDASQQCDHALLTSLYQSWQTEESDDDVQHGHDSDRVWTLHQANGQKRSEEEQGEGGAAEEEDNAEEEEVCKEGEAREEEGGGWITGLPDGVVVDTSPNYTAWLAGSMLNRLEADANSREGQMETLGEYPW